MAGRGSKEVEGGKVGKVEEERVEKGGEGVGKVYVWGRLFGD